MSEIIENDMHDLVLRTKIADIIDNERKKVIRNKEKCMQLKVAIPVASPAIEIERDEYYKIHALLLIALYNKLWCVW